MPQAGTITISIRPIDAGVVAAWLQSLPAPLWGVQLLNVPLLSNGVRLSIFEQFQSFANRKRKGGQFGAASMALVREDAEWLAAKVQRGMFGTSQQRYLPAQVVTVCRECAAMLARRSGRPKYRSGGLDAAIMRQKRNVSDAHHPVDPRWMKRLKNRKKRDEEIVRWLDARDGLWGRSLSRNSP